MVYEGFACVLDHIELAPVGGAVPKHQPATVPLAVAGAFHADFSKAAVEEVAATVAVETQRRFVDVEKNARRLAAHEHRYRIIIEKRAE
ncbi:MAG: hypothetical protein E5V92_28305 [Mesorhizobium sp.]|nr:MAG: hypothetical protein E5V92_28305 [Mesorhizobium sp.]